MRGSFLLVALAGLVTFPNRLARADDALSPQLRRTVDRGLAWLTAHQAPEGNWAGAGGAYPTAITGLAGMALLMEGSTLRDGKHAPILRKTTDWFLARCQKNGLIGNPQHSSESNRYLYGHGYGMLFLASVFGEEEDRERRHKIEDVLVRAVEFTAHAQTPRGGWGYLSSRDGNGFDEGSVTVTQLQALRACKNAGIPVPDKVVDSAMLYLEKCTTQRGGIIYSLAHGSPRVGAERPALTACAVACSFSAGEYDSDLAKKWLHYCQGAIPIDRSGRDLFGHWEYTHAYLAQAVYVLGDDGYAKLFPRSKPSERLVWSKYRAITFDYIASKQAEDGSWQLSGVGPAFSTSCCLLILQLDDAVLPIYQR
jgi:hypothetical protein